MAGLAPALAVAVGLALPGAGGAQEATPRPTVEEELQEELQEPAMATAPRQFRLALTGGALTWGDEPERGPLDGGSLVGVDIGRRAGPWIAFRLSGAYGRSSAANDTASADLNQYVFDLVASLRIAAAPLRRAGVVPFGTVGLASVVHDPELDGLVTKSQSAAAFGGGLDADLSTSFGLRAEWRRYLVDSEDLFDPANRTGEGRVADRFFGGVYLKL